MQSVREFIGGANGLIHSGINFVSKHPKVAAILAIVAAILPLIALKNYFFPKPASAPTQPPVTSTEAQTNVVNNPPADDEEAAFDRGDSFIKAIREGNLKAVQDVLKDNCTILIEERGFSVREATIRGYTEIVKALLADGASISDEDRGAAVRNATLRGYIEIVKALLSNDASISDEDRGRAVRMAAIFGHTEIVTALLADGASISDKDRKLAIVHAIPRGREEIVTTLLTESAASDLDYLEYAIICNQITIANNLRKIEKLPEPEKQSTPGIAILRKLMNHKIKKISPEDLRNAIDLSADEEIKECLLKIIGPTRTLNYATIRGQTFTVKNLLESGETSEDARQAAMSSAALFGHPDILKVLLDKDGIPEDQKAWALRDAKEFGRTEIVDILNKTSPST